MYCDAADVLRSLGVFVVVARGGVCRGQHNEPLLSSVPRPVRPSVCVWVHSFGNSCAGGYFSVLSCRNVLERTDGRGGRNQRVGLSVPSSGGFGGAAAFVLFFFFCWKRETRGTLLELCWNGLPPSRLTGVAVWRCSSRVTLKMATLDRRLNEVIGSFA